MRASSTALLLCASLLTACGGTREFDGKYRGTWSANTVTGPQSGAISLVVEAGDVSGFGTNETLQDSFDVSGTIDEAPGAAGKVAVTYTYGATRAFHADGTLDYHTPSSTGLKVMGGLVSMTLNGADFGTGKIEVTQTQ